jgi:hypothetical protein
LSARPPTSRPHPRGSRRAVKCAALALVANDHLLDLDPVRIETRGEADDPFKRPVQRPADLLLRLAGRVDNRSVNVRARRSWTSASGAR